MGTDEIFSFFFLLDTGTLNPARGGQLLVLLQPEWRL
jgi:hypothetical protein